MKPYPDERLEDRLVTYTLELEGRLYVIEHVPAQVNVETGERLFSPATVERIQQIVWEGRTATRTIETSVYEFAA